MKDEKEQGRFNREDSTPGNEEAYKAFAKDKRKRINTSGAEKVEYRRKEYAPGEERPARPAGDRYQQGERHQQGERRSYNPNFTEDNRFIGDRKPRGEYDKDRRPGYGNNRDDNGSRPAYGQGNSDRPRYDRGDRPEYAQRREYNDRGGEKRSYNPNRDSEGNREYRPRNEYGDKRPYQPRNEYGDRREQGERREYKPRTDSPHGEGQRKYGDNRGYQPRGESGQQREFRPRREYDGNREQQPRREYNKPAGAGRGGDRPGGYRKPDGRPVQPRYNSENYPSFPSPPIEDKMRLNRYVAMSGICSRREADELILSGAVTVNDEVITEMGAKVTADDVVKYNGEVIRNEKKVYIVMNKPKGYVTSVEDPHADKTVMDLVKNGCKERVYPVGRLDKSSLGVLLITNDGDLAKKLTHPSYEKKKVYQVTLDRPLTKADMDTIATGIPLDDGEIAADAVSYVVDNRTRDVKKNEIGIEIHSGRNRVVRRIFEHLGYRVMKLDRVYFAGLTKQRLKRGEWRFLTPREVQALRSGQYE